MHCCITFCHFIHIFLVSCHPPPPRSAVPAVSDTLTHTHTHAYIHNRAEGIHRNIYLCARCGRTIINNRKGPFLIHPRPALDSGPAGGVGCGMQKQSRYQMPQVPTQIPQVPRSHTRSGRDHLRGGGRLASSAAAVVHPPAICGHLISNTHNNYYIINVFILA